MYLYSSCQSVSLAAGDRALWSSVGGPTLHQPRCAFENQFDQDLASAEIDHTKKGPGRAGGGSCAIIVVFGSIAHLSQALGALSEYLDAITGRVVEEEPAELQ
jgi:hypothetical protein